MRYIIPLHFTPAGPRGDEGSPRDERKRWKEGAGKTEEKPERKEVGVRREGRGTGGRG